MLWENDIVFFNLHRRYLNNEMSYGGFLGIFLLAAFLKANGFEAQSYAGTLNNGKRLLDKICKEKKVGMIGLYCDYENVTENMFLSQYIKDTYHIPVILGGPQATALKEDFYRKSKIDAVVLGEGELTVAELVDFYLDGVGELNSVQGISYLAEDGLKTTEPRALIENLDSLPFIDDTCYLDPKLIPYDELSIMTGRGCPFHCAFCHEGHHTRKVRMRSVKNVLKEIKCYLQRRGDMPDLRILFTDDTFTLIPSRVKELCDGLIKLRETYSFEWFCEGHIHTLFLHPEMLDYMATAGCHRVQLGIEAGTQNVLDAYRKGSTLDEIRAVVTKCEKVGIKQAYSNIILGGAFFDEDIYKANLSFAKELLLLGKGIVEIGVVSYWPLAETSITNNPEQYGINIVDYDFITSVGDFPQTETDKLSKFDIFNLVVDMKKQLLNYMTYMLENGLVPLERVKSYYRESQKFGGFWISCLKQKPMLYAWYEMLLFEEACTSDSMSNEQFLDSHPMRCIGMYDGVSFDEVLNLYFDDKCFSSFERDVYILSAGKLSVREIMNRLTKLYACDVANDVKKALLHLEKNHMILFSLY